jgi:hypothetical protein
MFVIIRNKCENRDRCPYIVAMKALAVMDTAVMTIRLSGYKNISISRMQEWNLIPQYIRP